MSCSVNVKFSFATLRYVQSLAQGGIPMPKATFRDA
jgi:hypothetical protein